MGWRHGSPRLDPLPVRGGSPDRILPVLSPLPAPTTPPSLFTEYLGNMDVSGEAQGSSSGHKPKLSLRGVKEAKSAEHPELAEVFQTRQTVLDMTYEEVSSPRRGSVTDQVRHVVRYCWTYADRQAYSYVLDNFGSGIIITTNFFLTFAVTYAALEAAGCDPTPEDDDDPCSNRVAGIRPTNVMNYVGTAGGLSCALSMPVVGAIIDHSPRQWEAASIGAWVLGIVAIVQGMIASGETWPIVAFLQVISIAAYVVHGTVRDAWQPEMIAVLPHEDLQDQERNAINAGSSIAFFAGILGSIVLVLAIAVVGGLGTLHTAAVAQVLLGAIYLGITYYLWNPASERYSRPPPRHPLRPDETLIGAGLKKNWETFQDIRSSNRYLALYIGAMLFMDSAFNAWSGIAVIFMQVQLSASLIEAMSVILTVLFLSMPAAAIAKALCDVYKPVNVLRVTIGVMASTAVLAGLTIRNNDDLPFIYFFAIVWGFCFGGYYTCSLTIFLMLMPSGSDVEYMGIFNLSRQLLTFAPPLLFAGFNSLFNDLGWGLYVLGLFFVIALGFLFGIDLGAARAAVVELNKVAKRRSVQRLSDISKYSATSSGNSAKHNSTKHNSIKHNSGKQAPSDPKTAVQPTALV